MSDADIELIVQEVLKSLQLAAPKPAKKVLLVYTGAAIAFDETLDCLCRLAEEGYCYDVFCSAGAQATLDVDQIRSRLAPGRLYTGGEEAPEALVRRYGTVVVPALTINTAAKLAGCITDTPATRMIFGALMLGKNVVAATDGCCPDSPARERLGYRLPGAIKGQLRANLEKLKSYGAVLTTAENLGQAVKKAEAPTGESAPGRPAKEKKSTGGGQAPKRTVITKKQLDACPPGGALAVPAGSLVTALALDIARERGITIIKE